MTELIARLTDPVLRRQVLRYAFVGVSSNAIGYVVYLLLTSIKVWPAAAVAAVYLGSIVYTFVWNKGWTFEVQRTAPGASLRYVTVYAVAYVINIALLRLASDVFGIPHQWAQLALLPLAAVPIFFAVKYWALRPVKAMETP